MSTRNQTREFLKGIRLPFVDKVDNGMLLVINTIALVENVVGRCREKSGPPSCRKGCAHCCRGQADVTYSEADYISCYMDDHGTTLTDEACPFLQNGECLIYPVRPIMCRGWVSYDSDWCAKLDDDTKFDLKKSPINEAQFLTVREIHRALRDVLDQKTKTIKEFFNADHR